MRRTATALTAATVLVGVLAAGCGSSAPDTAPAGRPLSTATDASDAPTTAAPTTSTGTGAEETATAQEEGPPFVPLDQPGEAPGAGAASIVGARTGEHEGYDRVVLDLEAGPGEQVGWYAAAAPRPVQDASGELLDVDGDRFLDISVTGVANGRDERVDSAGRAAFTGVVDGGGSRVDQVWVGSAWEGQAQVLVGVDEGVTQYRVLVLEGPRLVVDVR